MRQRGDQLYRLVVLSLWLDLLFACAVVAWFAVGYEVYEQFTTIKRFAGRRSPRTYRLRWYHALSALVPVSVMWAPLCWAVHRARRRAPDVRRGLVLLAAVLKFFTAWGAVAAVVGGRIAGYEEPRLAVWLLVAAWAAAGGVVAALYLWATRGHGPRLTEVFGSEIPR